MESQFKNLFIYGLLFWSSFLFGDSTLFFNGNIIADFSKPSIVFSELWVVDGKVVKAGNSLQVSPETTRRDLNGAWVIPAFTDSHAHLITTGQKKRNLDLRQKSVSEILELVDKRLKENPNSKVVLGFGWDQSFWPNQEYPTIELLDKLSREVPIILYRVDGHAAWVNTLALRKAHLDKSQISNGIPLGILIDQGLSEIEKIIPSPSTQEIEQIIRDVVQESLSLGITGIHDPGISLKDFKILKDLVRRENLPFRFFEMLSLGSDDEVEQLKKTKAEIGLFEDRLSLRAVKIFLDGAMGSRGALFEDSYDDAPKTSGLQLISQSKLEALMRLADRKGFQIAIHAIGSKANQIVVDTTQKLFGKDSPDKRVRIEHAQVLSAETIKKMGSLKLIASMQPFHCSSDSKWIIQRIGQKRARFSYAWKSLLQSGVPLAFGSDSPIESLNPWEGISASEKRPLFPEEAIHRAEAFQAYTQGAAYASFQEKILGSLSPGKWADFILLAENPLKTHKINLLQEQPLATFFAGRLVYKKK